MLRPVSYCFQPMALKGFLIIFQGRRFGLLLISAFGLAMALVYIPIRLFLTITARSRRLKLLQRIRKLREAIAEPINKNS